MYESDRDLKACDWWLEQTPICEYPVYLFYSSDSRLLLFGNVNGDCRQ